MSLKNSKTSGSPNRGMSLPQQVKILRRTGPICSTNREIDLTTMLSKTASVPDPQKGYSSLYNNWTQRSKNKLQLAHERLNLVYHKKEAAESNTDTQEQLTYSVSYPKSGIGGLPKSLHTDFAKEKVEFGVTKGGMGDKHKTIKMMGIKSKRVETKSMDESMNVSHNNRQTRHDP
ncbi:unnamed protein product [Arabis nemorensis]|uniref:Uncharacterized protein n=1 Tax=Arabis nemorensis TaxID=586526 RepID=A0A565BTC2_9BRAS|nr:unnamed protein product [Arabis nemorensis]